jgi:UDP-glucuronate 4-epimerase
MQFLVTGVAGFIGHRIALALLEAGHSVVGIDNLNAYYDVELKRARLRRLLPYGEFRFQELDIADHEGLMALPERNRIDRVVHLAAQAGVRYSIENPFAYASANMTGHLSVLEFCRRSDRAPMLVYASSSSVYGNSNDVPYAEDAVINNPVSLYAATKRADELMSQAYAKLYGLRQIGVRFFTVYGPWGRPDMAYWTFTDRILRGETIRVFNHGDMRRDFTFIDDAIGGLSAIALGEAEFDNPARPHKLYNIGHNQPVALLDFIAEIEAATGETARIALEPMQPGDVEETCADISAMQRDYGYAPSTELCDGIGQFVDWYRSQRVSAGGTVA